MSLSERYWSKVAKAAADQCWLWQGAKTPTGYGKIWAYERLTYAHHVAMILDGRKRPAGLIALHACNNPSCVNPAHLSWGTSRENMQQALKSGRAPHHGRVPGERNGNAKLTEAAVRSIRADNRPRIEVAADYGVSPALISHIHYGRAWKHVQ